MGIQVWYLVASLFVISVKGQNGYYERPESSTPASLPSPPPDQRLAGMKEVVLYLTSEQVKSLQSAGAIVKPFPQFENAFQQQQYQQSVEETTEPQNQAETTTKQPNQDELEEFYKVLNIQQINEDLAVRAQNAREQSTEKPLQKYKYSPKFRQQDYASVYVQKKANRGKSSSTEYVRYLPNYEIEELKLQPYRAQPVPGYRFDTQANNQLRAYYQTEAPVTQQAEEIRKPEEIRRPEEIRGIFNIPFRTYKISEPAQSQQQQESPAKDQSGGEDKGPVTFEDKDRESVKPWASARNQRPVKPWEPASIWEPAKIQESEEVTDAPVTKAPAKIQRYQNVQIPSDGESEEREQEESPKTSTKALSSSEAQSQYSSLLAPLVQLEKITEILTKEKEELVNSEREIQKSLKDIRESGTIDEEKYAIELDKLNKNIGKQNALAQKLALEISKNSETQVTTEESNPERRKSEELLQKVQKPESTRVLVSIPQPSEVSTPQPNTVPAEVRSTPAPVQQQENVQNRAPAVEQRVPGGRNVYVKIDNPYIVQKVVPVQVSHDFPLTPIRHPDELVLRPLWEHK